MGSFLILVGLMGFVCFALVAFSPTLRAKLIEINKRFALKPFRGINHNGKYNVRIAWVGMVLSALLIVAALDK